MGRRGAIVHLFVVAVLASSVTVASAAPKTGCPAGESWAHQTVAAAAAEIWPALLDPSAFGSEAALAEFIDVTFDRNADDRVCVKTIWGADLNPNSHWFKVGLEVLGEPTQMFIVRDNGANASNR